MIIWLILRKAIKWSRFYGYQGCLKWCPYPLSTLPLAWLRLDSVSMLNVRTELRGRGPSRVSHLLRSAYKLFLISLTNIFPRQACTASPTSTRRRCRCCRRPRWPGSGVLWARTNPSPSLCSAELPFCRNWGGKKARKKSHLGMNHIHVNRSLHLENLFTHSVVFIFFQLPLLLQCWLEYEDCS